jgi:hypothetical protein
MLAARVRNEVWCATETTVVTVVLGSTPSYTDSNQMIRSIVSVAASLLEASASLLHRLAWSSSSDDQASADKLVNPSAKRECRCSDSMQ